MAVSAASRRSTGGNIGDGATSEKRGREPNFSARFPFFSPAAVAAAAAAAAGAAGGFRRHG